MNPDPSIQQISTNCAIEVQVIISDIEVTIVRVINSGEMAKYIYRTNMYCYIGTIINHKSWMTVGRIQCEDNIMAL